MSTRSLIGTALDDGGVKGIYCHYDGYLDGVGQTLVDHYTTTEKVMALMEIGDLSSLRANIGVKHNPAKFGWFEEQNQCMSLKRDHDELDCDARTFISELEFTNFNRSLASFVYLFKNGEWWVKRMWGNTETVTLRSQGIVNVKEIFPNEQS